MKEMIKIDGWATLPAGSKLIVPNPDWDGDKPETHFNLMVTLNQDTCVDLCGGPISVTIVKYL